MYRIMNNSCQSTGAWRPDKGCKHYKSVNLQCQEKQRLIASNIIFLMKKVCVRRRPTEKNGLPDPKIYGTVCIFAGGACGSIAIFAVNILL